MSPLVLLLAAAAGGLGAAARYVVDIGVARLAGTRFPWGVFVINLSGSLLLGVLTGALPGSAFVLGTGFLGGYTTFSTAMIDTVALWRDGERPASVVNALGMLLLGVLAAALGLALGAALRP
ncbi:MULTISPECIES: fluoride efflux transporter FluC [Microbacterium]|uniref:fluoride efflux transporter FluC n=1 Tax=Microbacterium TaxID=33882 RepID=UPI00217DADA3|nr:MULTISPECIES: CrcB family protein [Microbacterium]UWF77694.1 CrcB family protein [Microbacterium neungamense]WCM55863.1 CrcB family protein [Microbacterium sp. EF45047]